MRHRIINIGVRTGQEAVMTGFCHAFRRGVDGHEDPDIVFGFGAKHLIPMGIELGPHLAEAYGKATGHAGGRVGPGSDLIEPELGIYPHVGLIGVDLSHGVGFALASQWDGRGRVVGAITTDGGSNTGRAHEAFNLAALHRAPVVFAIVNNLYASGNPVSRTVATGDIAARSSMYGFPSRAVDGQDVVACYVASREAVERARRGDGPTLLEFRTYRYDSPNDPRPPGELEAWLSRDPLVLFRARLLDDGASEDEVSAIERACEDELTAAFAFADASDEPEPFEVAPDLYSPAATLAYARDEAPPSSPRTLTVAKAILEATEIAMRRDPKVFVMGLQVARAGDSDGTTTDLWREFGEERVMDMPIVQATTAAIATATALVGYRPLVVIGSPAIAMAAADEIFNVIPNVRFASNGKASLPVVFRFPMTGPGAGALDEGPTFGPVQSGPLHGSLTHVPGVYVVAPSTAADAKGLLLTALAQPDPVYFIEHKALMRQSGHVPEGDHYVPFGKGVVRRAGRDVTVVAVGWLAPRALAAAEMLAREGIDVEVIDPRTLVPLDRDLILGSVARTGRLVTVDLGFRRLNLGSEIVALASEELGAGLRASYRVAAPDSPVPAAAALNASHYPTVGRIAQGIRRVIVRSRRV